MRGSFSFISCLHRKNIQVHSIKIKREELPLPGFVIEEIKLPLSNLFYDIACSEPIYLNITSQ